jgi:hypothetical protein
LKLKLLFLVQRTKDTRMFKGLPRSHITLTDL